MSGYLIVGSQIRQRLKSEDKLDRYLFDRAIRVYVTLTPSLFFIVVVDFIFIGYFEAKIDWVMENSSLKISIKNMLSLPSVPYGTMHPAWSLMYEW